MFTIIMSVYYQNIGGLRTKCDTFANNLLVNRYDILGLTETWFNDSVHDGEAFDSEYLVFRRDRSSSNSIKLDGGGSLIAINKNYSTSCVRRFDWESTAEDVWVSIYVKNIKLNICCVYLPGYLDMETIEDFYNKINFVYTTNPEDNYLIIGDFNHRTLPIDLANYNGSDNKIKLLANMVNFCGLTQFNFEYNRNHRTLDLVLSNFSLTLKQASSNDLLVHIDSHHPALKLNLLSLHSSEKKVVYSYKDFFNANYDAINSSILQANFIQELITIDDINLCVDKFYQIINNIIDNNVLLKSKTKAKFPSWYSMATIRTYGKKLKYHKKWKKDNDNLSYIFYSETRAEFKRLIKIDYSNYINFVENNIESNTEYFWTYLKRRKNSNGPKIPIKVTYGSDTSNDLKENANLFAAYFKSTYSIENAILPPPASKL